MKRHPHLLSLNLLNVSVLTGLCLLQIGCATLHEQTCAQFEERRSETEYTTHYRYSESDSKTAAKNFKPLPRGESAVIRLYKMRLGPLKIKSCNHLTIHKEIYLQRSLSANVLLEEVREFYTAGGALIATKTEPVSAPLHMSGYYFGETLLPIPKNAPAGKYRIVSKLVLKIKGKSKITVLAKTSAGFQVLARN